MDMNNILYISALGFSIVLSVISTFITVKTGKKPKEPTKQEIVEDGTQDTDGGVENTKVKTFWSTLSEKLPQYIVSAEEFYNQIVGKGSGIKTGAQKLAQVLDKVKIDCLTSGVEYDEDKAIEKVNELVDLTNKVNTNK